MRMMIGNEVCVFLKKDYMSTIGDIFGILVEVTDDSLYIQSLDENKAQVFAVPRENIAYCTTGELPTSTRQVLRTQPTAVEVPQPQPQPQQSIIECLNVYINDQQVTSIPVPPTFPVHEWNEKILRAIMGNPEVKQALAGKIQKEIEYSPGEVYITVGNIVPPSQMPDAIDENVFTMGGQPTTDFLGPMQMAQRLSKVGSGGKDGQTEV